MKNKSHAYRNGGRLNIRVFFVVTSMFVLVYLLPHYAQKYDNSYINEAYLQEKIQIAAVEAKKAALSLECKNKGAHVENDTCAYSKAEIEARIAHYFPKNKTHMIAIAKAESQLSLNAKGYNCYYYQGKATTTPIKYGGKACQVKDRHLAFSYDCGLMQMNQKSKICPKETLDEHLARAAALSRIQGKQAWSTFNDDTFEKHLAKN